jgi:signal transduction histidine kinase
LFAGSELLREQYLAGTFPGYAIDRSGLGYRVGMAFVVGVVTGAYSRSLRRETARAESRAEAAERLAAFEAEARARLEELDVMKTDFIAITSHELRTPLAAVSGFVDTLRRRRAQLTDREVEEFLAIIHLQTSRLTRLVEDLLVVSRLEAGKLTFHAEPVAVGPFLADVIRGLGDDEARVDLHQDPELPATISVDGQRLAQVLTNLLTNAAKFAPENTRVVLLASPAGASAVAFEISDRGPGIPPAEIDRIFDRFHQAMVVQTRQAEGAGLGLYITRQLTEAMGGTVTVSSVVGEGSTFRVTIPRVPPDETTTPAPRSAAERSG